MTCSRRAALVVWLASLAVLQAQEPAAPTPANLLASTLSKVLSLIEPATNATPETFSTVLEVVKADGLDASVVGQTVELAFQSPDRLRLAGKFEGRRFAAARNGQEVWIHAPDRHFGVVGRPGQPRFASAPEKKDTTVLGRFKLPIPREQLILLPLLVNLEVRPAGVVDGQDCSLLQLTPKPEAIQGLKLPPGRISFWLGAGNAMPLRIGYSDGKSLDVVIRLRDARSERAWADERWRIPVQQGDHIETTALSHLTRFADAAVSILGSKVPTLGPATGERRVVATEGEGRLEIQDGTRVLFVKGTPEAMGRQHGALLRREIRDVMAKLVYGVGVGSSFEKGRWFFAEIEEAQRRLAPFIDPRYLVEMDAMAHAAGLEPEELRLANFFPELFHCSGFALYGKATTGGRMFHGRILDYLKGVGLEQNAVVIVARPDQGNAWVNVSYAGFVGSVTAMNEKHVALGEMGGRGEGNWDGKPMAQLVREVMERANSLDEGLAIMKKGPRTCEYYYVLSDATSGRAVGLAATPESLDIVEAGQSHPRLPHPFPDTVLMSAGDRYLALVERVKAGHGKFDAESARELMRRPVAMKSNIHSVLFAPDTLDFWVANADSASPASHTRYTRYNLRELLDGGPPPATASR